MKKMFKMVALMLALVLSLSMLAGCGADTSDKNENGQTVISVGDWPDKEGVALDTINLRKARFEEEIERLNQELLNLKNSVNNSNSNNSNNNNNSTGNKIEPEDGTISTGKLPDTGNVRIILILGVLSFLGTVIAIKYFKYREIDKY